MRRALSTSSLGALAVLLPLGSTGCDALFDESLVRDAPRAECEGRRPPARPDVPDGPGTAERFFVAEDLEVSTEMSWSEIGFNLDGLCSVGAAPVVECVPPSGAEPETDGLDGIDNSVAHHLGPLALLLEPRLEPMLREHWRRGDGNVGLRLTDYDGADDDPSVTVTFVHTVYGAAPAPEGGPPQVSWDGHVATHPDGSPAVLGWRGDDYFWLRSDDFVDVEGREPLLRAREAWVTGRVIVALLPDDASFIAPVIVGSRDAVNRVRLRSGVLAAHLSADGSALDEIILAGRWPAEALQHQVEVSGYCAGSVEHDIATGLFEEVMDLRAVEGTGGDGVECDAISFAMRGRAIAAHLGGVVTVAPRPPLCP